MGPSEARATSGEAAEYPGDAETFELQQSGAMEQPRWTEARLDDLNGKVDALSRKVDKAFEKVNERFDKVNERFDRLQLTLITAAAVIAAAVITAPHL